MLECVVNISEGRDAARLGRIAEAAGDALLDIHTDEHHHRSVFTLMGAEAIRDVTTTAIALVDLATHSGVHPRLGAVDVVPFVAYSAPHTVDDAVRARDAFAIWAGEELGVPCFLYGPLADGTERTLPDVRRTAWTELQPDTGPGHPHPSAGAICVGARPVLVAYNVWLPPAATLEHARRIAAAVRRPGLRTLGLMVGDRPQVSMNLVDPWHVSPADAYDAVAELTEVDGAELVGLVPEAVLTSIDPGRWDQLDLAADRTVEARSALRESRSVESRYRRGAGLRGTTGGPW